MSQNFLRSPKNLVLTAAPKAKCVKDWVKSGTYRIDFGQEVKDFNNRVITSLQTGTANPADAWFTAAAELRLV